MSPRENAATKAERLLASGRVVITHVDGREVDAIVRGDSGALYSVKHLPGQWSCSCDHAPTDDAATYGPSSSSPRRPVRSCSRRT